MAIRWNAYCQIRVADSVDGDQSLADCSGSSLDWSRPLRSRLPQRFRAGVRFTREEGYYPDSLGNSGLPSEMRDPKRVDSLAVGLRHSLRLLPPISDVVK